MSTKTKEKKDKISIDTNSPEFKNALSEALKEKDEASLYESRRVARLKEYESILQESLTRGKSKKQQENIQKKLPAICTMESLETLIDPDRVQEVISDVGIEAVDSVVSEFETDQKRFGKIEDMTVEDKRKCVNAYHLHADRLFKLEAYKGDKKTTFKSWIGSTYSLSNEDVIKSVYQKIIRRLSPKGAELLGIETKSKTKSTKKSATELLEKAVEKSFDRVSDRNKSSQAFRLLANCLDLEEVQLTIDRLEMLIIGRDAEDSLSPEDGTQESQMGNTNS